MSGSGIIEPVDEDDEVDERPAAAGCGSPRWWPPCALVLLAVVVAFNVGRGRTPLGAEPEPESPAHPHAAPRPRPPRGSHGVRRRDRRATSTRRARPPEEYPELAPLAVDGNPDDVLADETYGSSSARPG